MISVDCGTMPPRLKGAFVLRNVTRIIRLLLFCCVALSLLTPPVHAQNERLVQNKLPDQPAQPYDSRDRATIQRHVAQAQAAGIDALVQSWYGPSGGVNNMTESNLAALLDVAGASGLRAAVDFETQGPFFGSAADVQGALAALLNGNAPHPAYLKVGGRPVIFFWRQQRFSVDEWAAIRAQVDPNHASIWIAEGADLGYLRVFDGIHLYSVAWSADPTSTLVNFGAKVRKAAQGAGGFRYWVATAMPGYDDTRLRGAGGFTRARGNGDYLRASFAGATQSGADWVIITSFNEWLEGTQIEPSVSYGDSYLNLTRELATAYRGGAAIAPAAANAPAAAAALPAADTASQKALAVPMSQPATSAPTDRPVASPIASATATQTPLPTATLAPTVAPTFTATATAAASATRPRVRPTGTPAPAETPAPPSSSPLDGLPLGAWAAIGGGALMLGAVLGAASARRSSPR
jgi:Glycosyl hydrolase family 99